MEQNEQTTENLNQDSKKKLDLKNKKTLMIIGGIIGSILLITIIFLVKSHSVKTNFKCINLNDYLTIDISGYDTLGTADVDFDKEAFLADYDGKIKVKEEFKKDDEYRFLSQWGSSDIEIFLEHIDDVFFSKDYELSNGMKIKLNWDIDEEINTKFNYTVKYTNAEHQVKGLNKFKSFDPFENLEISYSGISSQGIVNLAKKDSNGCYEKTSYVASQASDLANGDTITVKFNMEEYSDSYIDSYGCYPSVTEKEFIVEGLDSYVSSVNDITDNVLDEYKKQTEDIFMAYAASDPDFNRKEKTTVNSLDYQGYYLLSPKTNIDLKSNSGNILYIVYKVNVTVEYKLKPIPNSETATQDYTFYYHVEYTSPSIDANGNCTANLANNVPISHHTRFELGSQSSFYTKGYETLDDLFTDCVQSKLDTHTYESSVIN